MRNTFRRSIGLVIASGSVALAASISAGSVSERETLDALLVHYDREPHGPSRDSLAARIDAMAHQKYATVSRLYWHTDLASAKADARERGRPILHLRMLGSLAEDLSCANSRLFRATLYANQDLSRFLRERFVLYWSSERPVPHLTIDYGDGRRLERTATGNSAHYVLDERGNVLDVLPGLYSASAFRHVLEASLALAATVRDTSSDERARLIVEYHQQQVSAAERDWSRVAGTPWIPRLRRLATPTERETSFAAAQRASTAKASIEVRDLRIFDRGVAPQTLPQEQIEMWAAPGQLLYGQGVRLGGVLDDASRALVFRLHNGGPQGVRADDAGVRAMFDRLEQTIVADTALNQLSLRPQISREIVRRAGRIDFPKLNEWIYTQVFRTPSSDPWLGLLERDVFTGLPGDGVVVRGTR